MNHENPVCKLPLPAEAEPFFLLDARLSWLIDALFPYLTDEEKFPHHSWNEHYYRVLRYAALLAGEERLGEKDIPLLMACALLHDIGYHIPHEKEETHHQVSHRWVLENLREYGYNDAEIELISRAVLCHDHTFGDPPHLVGKILHDADTLDKGSISARLFGVAIDPAHPLRREVAHKIANTADVARAYLARLNPLPGGSCFYTDAGKRIDAGRIELIRKVFETYIAEMEGKLL